MPWGGPGVRGGLAAAGRGGISWLAQQGEGHQVGALHSLAACRHALGRARRTRRPGAGGIQWNNQPAVVAGVAGSIGFSGGGPAARGIQWNHQPSVVAGAGGIGTTSLPWWRRRPRLVRRFQVRGAGLGLGLGLGLGRKAWGYTGGRDGGYTGGGLAVTPAVGISHASHACRRPEGWRILRRGG